jgi:predicted RNA-binding protein YlxR (DUF448 family)
MQCGVRAYIVKRKTENEKADEKTFLERDLEIACSPTVCTTLYSITEQLPSMKERRDMVLTAL